jgi:hypothetical protein
MAAIPVSRPCTPGNPRAGIRIPDKFALNPHPNREHGATDDRKNFSTAACIRNKSFFFAPDKRYNSRSEILENTALKTSSATKSGKTVQLTQGGFGFHKSKTLPPQPKQDKFLKSFLSLQKPIFYPLKTQKTQKKEPPTQRSLFFPRWGLSSLLRSFSALPCY